MYLFRINCTQGIGHFMRCKWLALNLISQGEKVGFLLDENPKMTHLYQELSWPIYLIPKLDELEDAHYVINVIKAQNVPCKIILDSYSLGIMWERCVNEAVIELIVIDDLAREHDCDLLIDQKYVEEPLSRYEGKLPVRCCTFLGPQYALLSPEYTKSCSRAIQKKTILFSLGGGGDWLLLTSLIHYLALNEDVNITVILGPQANNTLELCQLAERNVNVQLIHAPDSLYLFYLESDLFIGALGTSLYELLVTKTPSLTFSIATNQQNNPEDLEQLGHYFHLPDFLTFSLERQVKLIIELLANTQRITSLIQHAAVSVDGQGVKRVVLALLKLDSIEKTKTFKNDNQPMYVREHISGDLSVRPVLDQDIMNYLRARNNPSNAEKMTVTAPIDLDEHICWWFKNERSSYVIYEKDQPIAFIWHQCLLSDSQQYLIGGWFTIEGRVNFHIALIMLKWQLLQTQQQWPKARWLAVINKENKFVRLLNQYMGFTDVEPSDKHFSVIEHAFPKASPEDFYFIDRAPLLPVR
ncbi:UDP-2,4-diacetamido-2,4,6-trideoxy-beta-L-altropyranose hydrolase [Marinomonas sp. 2405UD68-3]|uniref:UDP-2,4-diacetamido-2,4, 6-trideoxy-beta-L-altropyranose hydrolase n=1 Tax=Marinomonas sp. 2405UD68-3 TaxID=3391835 RepID=UPI0039C9C657